MVEKLSRFERLDGLDTVYTAHKGTLRCFALTLKDGGLCLFSPVAGLGDAARESLAGIGEVKVLLAPNHYHNKGINEYVVAFPDAVLCGPEASIPRLQKVTGQNLSGLNRVIPLLRDTMEILQPEGLKTGEVWVRIDQEATISWLVVDAFSGPKPNASGAPSASPEMLKTFPNFGVGDKTAYVNWVSAQVRADQPHRLGPCHGSIIQAPDLPEKLLTLIADMA